MTSPVKDFAPLDQAIWIAKPEEEAPEEAPEEEPEEEPEEDLEVAETVTCPECWELNSDESACVLTPNNGCFELTCDNAKLAFNFEPKMFGLDDASDTDKFGPDGPQGNTNLGKYEYSHGLGTTGQEVTVEGDEMVFSVTVTNEASEERVVEDVEVNGNTLILGAGRHTFGTLTVTFACRVDLITEVSSDTFIINDDNDVKSTQLGGEDELSLTGDLVPTFTIALYKDAAHTIAITSENLKLGEEVFFVITWLNNENSQVSFFAKQCQIIDGATEVSIISETCLAGVVDVTNHDLSYHALALKFSYKSFAVDNFSEGESRTQTLKCGIQLCLNASCSSQIASSDGSCPATEGFEFAAP